jgi:hypothetical protein
VGEVGHLDDGVKSASSGLIVPSRGPSAACCGRSSVASGAGPR